jgi:gliding motility-associated-like protein
MRKGAIILISSAFFLLISKKLFPQTITSFQIENGKIIRVAKHKISSQTVDAKTKDEPIFSGFANVSQTKKTSVTNGTITLTIATVQTSCGYNNGSITASASGGTQPYIYSLSSSPPGYYYNTGYFPDLISGNYTVTVTDANGQTISSDVSLSNIFSPPKISVISLQRPSTCTSSDGYFVVSGSEGTPPYEYSVDLVNFQTNDTFSNLAFGEYYFFVRDANGCIAAKNNFDYLFNFLPSGCASGSASTYSGGTCGNNGHIDLNSSSSSSDYTYSMDGVNFTSNGYWDHLGPGIYKVYSKSKATGEVNVFAYSIFQDCYIHLDYISVDAACQQSDGSLTVTASNGTAPYLYTIDGINFQSSNVFTGLAAGNYNVSVRDANGFTSSLGAIVYDKCPQLSLKSTNENCSNGDGTITATAVKGTAPYQYSIDGTNFQNGNLFSNLVAGTYTITLKDALGFTTTENITLQDFCIPITTTISNSYCGKNNGSITASATNGTAPYQFSIDGINFQASNVFNNLTPGNYTITAKDATGKTGTTNVSIIEITGPQISVNSNPASCTNDDGTIQVTGTGGSIPFQYSIDGSNFQTANVFNNLAANTYTAWIKDANSCLASQTIIVTTNCPSVTATATSETCNNKNGSIAATGSNGTAPYQYSIDGTNFQNSNIFSALAAGNYTITIRDAIGIVNTTNVNVGNICPIVTAIATDGLCSTNAGTIVATCANGTAPYQYSIDGINFQNNNTFSGLTSGSYTVTVKDVNGLTNTTIVTVNNFPAPEISVVGDAASCFNNDGNITITASSGTSPFQFSIDEMNFQSNNVFSNVSSGNYTATIEDSKGCTATRPVTILLADNLSLATGNDITLCEGNSTVLVASSNGTNFSWSPSGSLNDATTLTPTATPSITTKYYVTAKLGVCSAEDSVMIFVNPAPIADAGKDTTICFGQSVQLNGNGGMTYMWSPPTYLNNPNINNPEVNKPENSISYDLNVIDVNGCKSLSSSTVNITVTPPAKVFAGNDTTVAIGEPLQLNAVDINNSGFIQYSWSPSYGLDNNSIANPVLIGEKNISYTVTATTPAGCVGTDEINIKVYQGPEIYVPKGFTPNGDGKNDLLRAIPVGIKEFKYFAVYNRWGQRVFFTKDPSRGWDGTVNGVLQDVSAFVWIANGVDYKGNIIQRKGTVMLIR